MGTTAIRPWPPERMSARALGLVLVLGTYLLATVICYNDFLGVSASSRWPLLVLTLLAGPIAFAAALSSRHRPPAFRFSLGWLLTVFLALEILHIIPGPRTEIIAILSLAALAALAILTRRRSKADLVGALVLVCALYLALVYPLAFGSGMVGTEFGDKGVFVARYLPGIDALSLNGHFKSGRGVVGIVGGVILLYALARLRARRPGPHHLAGIAVGGLALLVCDSRGVILACLLVVAVLFAPIPAALRARFLFALPFGVIVLQPILLGVAVRYRDALSSLGALSRQGIADSDLSRVFAWLESLRLITASAKSAAIGYGAFGAVERMEAAFGRDHPHLEQLVSAHNLLLQLLLDGGVVLLVVFVGYLGRVAVFGWRHARTLRRRDLDAVAVLGFLVLYGVTGSVVSLDRINETMFVLVLTLVAVDRQLHEAVSFPARPAPGPAPLSVASLMIVSMCSAGPRSISDPRTT